MSRRELYLGRARSNRLFWAGRQGVALSVRGDQCWGKNGRASHDAHLSDDETVAKMGHPADLPVGEGRRFLIRGVCLTEQTTIT
jgi:hypothetical protein